MTHVAEANDYRLATDGARQVAAAKAGCLCRDYDPSPVCPVHANRWLEALVAGVEPNDEPIDEDGYEPPF
jgi:hypothetical protein